MTSMESFNLHFSHLLKKLNISIKIREEKRRENWLKFLFSHFFVVSQKAFIKPFEATQSVKIKI